MLGMLERHIRKSSPIVMPSLNLKLHIWYILVLSFNFDYAGSDAKLEPRIYKLYAQMNVLETYILKRLEQQHQKAVSILLLF